MSKYVYFAVGFIVLALLLSVKTLYSAVDRLKQEKTTLELSLKNASLNETISQQAIKAMHDDITDELQKTKYSIKNQLIGIGGGS